MKNMKIIKYALICIAAALLLAGCGVQKAAESGQKDNQETVTPEAEEKEKEEENRVKKKPEKKKKKPEITEEKEEESEKPETVSESESEHTDNFYIHEFDSYDDLLYLYKEASDRYYTQDQIDQIFGYGDALLNHSWPTGTSSDYVGYVYYDVDSDGKDEMIITYDNRIADIYGYFGDKIRRIYSAQYESETTLYPGGILKAYKPKTAEVPGTDWYSYDARLGSYFEDFEELNGEYYTFSHYNLSESEYEEIESIVRSNPDGDMPVWIYEWDDQLTKSDYNKLLPKSEPIKLTEAKKLADVVLPDDYKPKYEANEPREEETIPEYLIYVISPDGYANLRKGPGTEYDVICRIPTGESMEVYRETALDKKGKKWLKVAYFNPEGTSDGSEYSGAWETGWISDSQVE